ncbi:MAG: phytoene desaturase family protein [Actinomycetota bacterium]
MVDVVVIGAGPNGLAAAVILVAAGLHVEVIEAADSIGGGTRTDELTLPGYLHDVCSAVHPTAMASPFFQAFDLARHGVTMRHPEITYAHPLDDGRVGVAYQSLEETVTVLNNTRSGDGTAWRRLLEPLVAHQIELTALTTSDLRASAIRAALTAPGLASRLTTRIMAQGGPRWNFPFTTAERDPTDSVAAALFTGVAAHANAPVRGWAPAATGLVLAALGHASGWPIPLGGSQSITNALARVIVDSGGRIRTGHRVTNLADLPPARAILLDVTPAGLLQMADARLPRGYAHWLRRFTYGNAACTVHFALTDPVPWTAPECSRAGTLHLGGSRAQIAAAEARIATGRHADQPYVLVSQPSLVDPGRTPDEGHVLWSYTHVPAHSDRDVSAAVIAQIERFAPGFRDTIAAHHVMTAARLGQYNANYIGGDIAAGATTPWQLIARPAPRWNPYRTPIPGVYLCSASTPPGPGVHGMSGAHAARHVLREVFKDRRDPLSLVAALP